MYIIQSQISTILYGGALRAGQWLGPGKGITLATPLHTKLGERHSLQRRARAIVAMACSKPWLHRERAVSSYWARIRTTAAPLQSGPGEGVSRIAEG